MRRRTSLSRVSWRSVGTFQGVTIIPLQTDYDSERVHYAIKSSWLKLINP